MFNFKNDKSWFVVLILLFTFMPLGILALIGKIVYTIYKDQRIGGDDFDASVRDYRQASADASVNSELEKSLHEIENDLKDTFDTWKATSRVKPPMDQDQGPSIEAYSRKGLPVDLPGDDHRIIDVTFSDDLDLDEGIEAIRDKDQGFEAITEGDEGSRSSDDLLSLEHLEVKLNTDIDLTINDVHIDTEITFDNEPEDHNHEGETPLKIITCTMCGTDNSIYKIDPFETPTCEKCGMLLLDRS